MFTNKRSHFGKKLLKMSVYCSITIIMSNIECVTISSRRHADTRNIPVGRTIERFSLHTLRLEVESSMEMIAPQLGKISTQEQGEIKGGTKYSFLSMYKEGKKKEEKPHPNPPQRRGNRGMFFPELPPFGGIEGGCWFA